MDRGYIQIYTGNGKGKTTAALGQGLRAVGRGLKVIMVQFLKGWHTGELESIKKIAPDFNIIRFAETKKFLSEMEHDEKLKLKEDLSYEIEKLYNFMQGDFCDILILDEIMGAINGGLIEVEDVCKIMDKKPDSLELIMTGRNVPEAIAQRADLITEMKMIKHYADEGVPARKGIEL